MYTRISRGTVDTLGRPHITHSVAIGFYLSLVQSNCNMLQAARAYCRLLCQLLQLLLLLLLLLQLPERETRTE